MTGHIKPKNNGSWLLLIHQIPPKPSYFRVKIWRKLQHVGAVAIKSSVYVLPKSEQSYEAFQWVMREIIDAKGEATICGATFVEGLADHEVEALFNAARNADYAKLAGSAKKAAKVLPPKSKLTSKRRKEAETKVTRLKRRLAEVVAIDFFGASGRVITEGLITEIQSRLHASEPGTASIGRALIRSKDLRGRTWVTRRTVHVDRIGSAWLIHRFIDPEAKFKFVEAKGYQPSSNELRFDMFEAEFTHEGDLCTFEVLIARAHLNDPALRQLAQIIHEIDLQDAKYGRVDTAGIAEVINGICALYPEDLDRLSRGSAILDALYQYFTRRKRK
ncbi:MAG: chromate resistance protein [Deltaproteobacteria bacterium]|nr:chromate resistance protein [Deltaproteobacteria bacterium]